MSSNNLPLWKRLIETVVGWFVGGIVLFVAFYATAVMVGAWLRIVLGIVRD